MNIDIRRVALSRRGSYMSLAYIEGHGGLHLRTTRGTTWGKPVFRIELVRDGEAIPFEMEATPSRLCLTAEGGQLEMCLAEPKVLRLRGWGVGIRFTRPEGVGFAQPNGDGRWLFKHWDSQHQYMFTALSGRVVVEGPFQPGGQPQLVMDFCGEGDGEFEGAIEEFRCAWRKRDYPGSFDERVATVADDFARFHKLQPSVPGAYERARELAAYVNWSCLVAPEGYLRRETMYMSKNWMTFVWSWDHCFNAMALAYRDPSLAWDQFMTLFDNQDASGALPDMVNDTGRFWLALKPPVHGWALAKMMKTTDWIGASQLKEAYGPLAKWANFYLDNRDHDGDGVYSYEFGNSSGWDNCTVFDDGYPLEGPDLNSYLAIQCEVLADVADRLGKARTAASWRGKSQMLIDRLIEHSWDGSRFLAMRSGDHHVVAQSHSLYNYLPIVLGKRLPKTIREKMIADLQPGAGYLTEHGLATESPQSSLYQPDGYWRGPIWAPSTMIIVDGLAQCGPSHKALAKDIARRFCDMCAANGFGENFDALNGTSLRDPGYTWTASVFLVLAHEYLRR